MSSSDQTGFMARVALGLAITCFLAALSGQDMSERFELRGVFGKSAAVEDTVGGGQIVLRVGDELNGYTVAEITQVSITLERGGERVVIQLVADLGPSEGGAIVREETGETPGQAEGQSALLAGIAGDLALFEVQPEGFSIRRRVGEELGESFEVIEIQRDRITIELASGERRSLGIGERVPTSGLTPEGAGSTTVAPGAIQGARRDEGGVEIGAGERAERVYFLGSFFDRAIFELVSPAGRRTLSVAVGEELRPGLFLASVASDVAELESRAPPMGSIRVLLGAPTPEADPGTPGAVEAGHEIPAYPLRVPMWERHLARLLGETRITLALIARDLDEVVGVLRDIHGIPVCLDPDAVEGLTDAEFKVSLEAHDDGAYEVLDRLVSGRPLIVEPAFGCAMIGMEATLGPIRDAHRRRDGLLAEIDALRGAVRAIPVTSQSVLEDAMEEELRFTRFEAPGEVRTLGQLTRLAGGVLGVHVTFSVASVGGQKIENLAISPPQGEKSLKDHFIAAIGETGVTYRWNGNVLTVLTVEEADARDRETAAREAESRARFAELLVLPREATLGLEEPISGPLWAIIQAVARAGALEVHADESAWRRLDETVSLSPGDDLGDLQDALEEIPRISLVNGSEGRIFILTM